MIIFWFIKMGAWMHIRTTRMSDKNTRRGRGEEVKERHRSI